MTIDVQLNKLDLIYNGSVKNIYSTSNKDYLIFEFTDQYSVFDWGAMPDLIPGKGQALGQMAGTFFNLLSSPKFIQTMEMKNVIDHHYVGFYNEEKKIIQNSPATRQIVVKKIIVPSIDKNYQFYQSNPVNVLLPLEVIFRFAIEKGSSILKRADNKEYLKDLGLNKVEVGMSFDQPLIEFSTKLEKEDRYLTYQQAQVMSGLNKQEWEKLLLQTAQMAKSLRVIFKKIGTNLIDGKFEFGIVLGHNDIRNFMLVDSIGPDELRIVDQSGNQLSKESLREYYRDSSWFMALQESKLIAQKDKSDFKNICLNIKGEKPQNLPAEWVFKTTQMYNNLAQKIDQFAKEYL